MVGTQTTQTAAEVQKLKRLSRPFWAALISGSVGLLVLVTVLTIALDRNSLRASENILKASLSDHANLLSKLALEYAYWDESVDNLVHETNIDWINETFIDYLQAELGIEALHVVDGNNDAVLHIVDDEIVDTDLTDRYGQSLQALIVEARASHVDNVPRPVTGYVGRLSDLYSVSAARLTTYDGPDVQGTDHVLVFADRIDSVFLDALASKLMVSDLHLSFAPSDLWQAELPITAPDGRTIGYMIWSPELAGFQLRPAIAAGVFVIGLAILIAARIFVRQATSLVHELETTKQEALTARNQLEVQVRQDSLTGLGNRRFLDMTLESLPNSAPYRPPHALISIDLDGFKDINDDFGHDTGDLVLQHVAQVLETVVPGDDTVFRLGGDEFVIVFAQADKNHVQAVASLIVDRLSAPVTLNGNLCYFGASAGIAYSRQTSDLLRHADIALYSAKRRGRGRSVVYSPAILESNGLAKTGTGPV